MKRALVTGHTSGIGEAVYDLIDKTPGYVAIGASRSTGKDITKEKFILDYINCDVIINNAYDGLAQSNILLDLFTAGYKGHVISTGSVSAYRTDAVRVDQFEYSANKQHLENIHNHVFRNGLHSSLFLLGTVDTVYNKTKKCPKLSVETVAKRFVDVIGTSERDVYLTPTIEKLERSTLIIP